MKCHLCSKETEFLEKHHIIPKSRGGGDTESNLIEVCSDCHSLAHDVSFKNDRGGLVKEGILRAKFRDEMSKKWLVDNEELVNSRLENLYHEDLDKYMLLITLLDLPGFNAQQIREWYETGKTSFKTTITFKTN